MNYLHQPITGFIHNINQLFSGRGIYKLSSSYGQTEHKIPHLHKALFVGGNKYLIKCMDVWHVENKRWTKLRLLRMYSDHFRVIEAGIYEPLLINGTYTLVNKKYSSLFKSLDSQVERTPVKIRDFLTKTKNEDYVELKVLNDVRQETINKLDSSGRKLWRCYGDIFVSGMLKEELVKLGGDELAFSLGFSMFGGINANADNMGF